MTVPSSGLDPDGTWTDKQMEDRRRDGESAMLNAASSGRAAY